MATTAPRAAAPAGSADQAALARERLLPLLERVEQRLAELQRALGARDMPCIELHAGELQRALAGAVDGFMRAARCGGVPQELRRRFALAGAQIAAQRDALARATAALDRALDVLMPGFGSGLMLYEASGTQPAPRAGRIGSVEA